jgi:PAS domain S-box-containing protein
MPYVFWKDRDGRYQGGNQHQAEAFGFKSPKDFIGKTIFDLLKDQKAASMIDEIDNQVMISNSTLVNEEKIFGPEGERVYLTQKSPINDNKGNVIGMLGFAMDITELKKREEIASKERDRLMKLAAEKETERLRAELAAKTKFLAIADQVAHDIRSPLMALEGIAQSCREIPERERIALREATMTISDIAHNLLSRYRETSDAPEAREIRQPVLISALLLQLLTEKRYQYEGSGITFDHEFAQEAYFSFIKIVPTALKRSVSNVINNAVDAFEGRGGKVRLKLQVEAEWVKIVVEDTGKGMSKEILDRINQHIPVTVGKAEGHGIGLAQVRETLERNQGTLSIRSEPGKGTQVTLTFPRIKAPAWMLESLVLRPDDLMLILDDDRSIHGAWDSRLDEILGAYPEMGIQHFEKADEALKFIKSLSESDRNRLFLLTDYELLNQSMTGLDVVEQSQVQRSVVVTSHYANPTIQQAAISLGTKILPKQLAVEVSIVVEGDAQKSARQVKLVMVDDDALMIDSMKNFLGEEAVDYYLSPDLLLKNLNQYGKDVRIMLDNTFTTSKKDGLTVAKLLHDEGYTKIFMLSGKVFQPEEVPEYLTVLLKGIGARELKKRILDDDVA